jgi:cellulose biosynthesis protein BcsQ
LIATVANFKGGVGKTLISLFIANHPDIKADIYTNDPNGLTHEIFSNYHFKSNLNEIKEQGGNIIFDSGGFIADISHILKKSDLIIVPTTGDINSLKTSLDAISEYIKYNQNILVVETLSTSNSLVEDAISENFTDIPILKLRYSKIFDNAIKRDQSIYEFVKGDRLKKVVYRGVLEDVEDIIEAIKILTGQGK